MYWVYESDQKDIMIIALEPHPEDEKNGAYDRINLSDGIDTNYNPYPISQKGENIDFG